ncbi:NUDIX hydrolase [Pleomorphomonas koreensis]|uniref:NUDIX hydrolase n=1 Tax=Pleomorphomonas koreensis TaxID=257440 RepID=UPI0003FED4AE|nr:NUDIX hydrolase [Pleomorphomonas koreensis]
MTKPPVEKFRQVAALPYRLTAHGYEVVMITTRDSGRWILPKGWPIKGLKPYEAAETEAMEEAGLIGTVATKPCGRFTYVKQFPKRQEKVLVEVFPMAVEKQLDDWQEKGQREVRFFNPVDAAALVSDAGVGDLILAFFVDLAKKKAAGTLKAPAAGKASDKAAEEDQASPSNNAVER